MIALMVAVISPQRSLECVTGELVGAAFLILQVLLLISNALIPFIMPRSGRIPIIVRCIVGAIINISFGLYLFFMSVLIAWRLG